MVSRVTQILFLFNRLTCFASSPHMEGSHGNGNSNGMEMEMASSKQLG
jgi:hypothetical protein